MSPSAPVATWPGRRLRAAYAGGPYRRWLGQIRETRHWAACPMTHVGRPGHPRRRGARWACTHH